MRGKIPHRLQAKSAMAAERYVKDRAAALNTLTRVDKDETSSLEESDLELSA